MGGLPWVATNMLYRWKENAERKNGGIILSEDERTELKSLRKEVKTLRVEKEILKMPTSFSQKK
jgi:transposase